MRIFFDSCKNFFFFFFFAAAGRLFCFYCFDFALFNLSLSHGLAPYPPFWDCKDAHFFSPLQIFFAFFQTFGDMGCLGGDRGWGKGLGVTFVGDIVVDKGGDQRKSSLGVMRDRMG
ncbi:hypothetical protein DDR33_24765 [Pararcticibacter amylolyticus]|uniref:Uncharacterized protein n=1 Tax=Pararcticibacter amylolyticus TaxID=2173175 RepID=A0A2U2P9B2_9SPHI|nr:hypothetical protein DDR33_24765 [Pararcticibacter amylolyticus]